MNHYKYNFVRNKIEYNRIEALQNANALQYRLDLKSSNIYHFSDDYLSQNITQD